MIQKPLSCEIQKTDVQLDYENIIIKYTDGYESEIKKIISIIDDEIGDIWDDMWTWDDVVDRFEKNHFLWLVLDGESPIACSWFEKKSKKDLYIYNTYLIPELRGTGLTEKLFSIRNNLFYNSGFSTETNCPKNCSSRLSKVTIKLMIVVLVQTSGL